eukprot:snap_masked-scaffold_9-processed-gene-7.50-mRNA-1 protein AED:1.00 eAED:1.00 QI:0/0/0/0/1/1/3/0/61
MMIGNLFYFKRKDILPISSFFNFWVSNGILLVDLQNVDILLDVKGLQSCGNSAYLRKKAVQ